MVSMMRSSRLAAGIGVALFAMACTQSSPSGTADGTWSGQDSQREYDFDAPLNWVPRGVPTGTAIIQADAPSAPFILFSSPTTTLGAIRLTGNLGITIETGRTVSVLSGGLTLCCKAPKAMINGTLTGNVVLGEVPGQAAHQIFGSGTINGNVNLLTGTVSPGNGEDAPGMTIVGTYKMSARSAIAIDAWPKVPSHLDVSGTAELSGLLAIFIDDLAKVPTRPFRVLTAGQGVRGTFDIVKVVNAPFKAEARYDKPNEVWITLSQ